MQVLPRRPRHRVVRLRPDQLIPELEPAVHLAEDALLLEPRQGLSRRRRGKLHHFVQRQIRQTTPEHGSEIERRPCRRVEPPDLAVEHRPDRTRNPDVRHRLRVERLQIVQERARAVRQPLLGEQLERQRVAVARQEDPRHRHVRHATPRFRHQRRHELLRRGRRERLQLERPHRLDARIGSERTRRRDRAQLVRSRRQNQKQTRVGKFARDDVQDRRARVVGRVNVVHHQHQRALLRPRFHRLEEAVGQPQRDDFRRPLDGLRHTGKRTEDLGRDPRQLAQRLRIGPADGPLQRQLLDELGQDRERQLALRVVRLGTRDGGAFHLTRRYERVGERRLPDAGVAHQHHDARRPAPYIEPRIVQLRELPLAADQRLRLEAPLAPLRHLAGRLRGPPPPLPQQVRDTHQVGARLGSELFGQPRLESSERLERVGAIPHPRPCLDQPAHRVLRQGIEVEQHLRVALHGREVARATTRVHLLHQTVADPGHQPGAPFVLPLLELHGAGHLEAVEERTTDLGFAAVEAAHVRVHYTRHEGDRRSLHHEMLASHLLLHHREGLRQRVAGAGGRHVRPEEIHQVVARELAPPFHREADQQGEVFARAEADLLTRIGEQQRHAQTQEMQVRRQRTARGVSEWYY